MRRALAAGGRSPGPASLAWGIVVAAKDASEGRGFLDWQ